MKNTQFTPEQTKALAAFEEAATSHDLHAFGNGRKYRGHASVVACHAELVRLGIADALTPAELGIVKSSQAFIS